MFRIIVIMTLFPSVLFAEIVTDSTITKPISLSGQKYEIKQEYGRLSGSNMFYSFEKFNIGNGESAVFIGRQGIRNIISRVTGEASVINGSIESIIPSANFYFINPKGITFGNKASINISGRLHISTSEGLRFEDGKIFGINTSDFSESQPLSSSNGKSFIRFDNAEININAEKTEFVSSSFEMNSSKLISQNGITITTGKAALSNGSIIDVSTNTEKNSEGISISADDVTIIGERKIDDTITASSLLAESYETGNAGNICIRSKDSVALIDGGRISASTFGTGNGGEILIESKSLKLDGETSDGINSEIFNRTFGQGNAGNIIINSETISFKSGTWATTSTVGTGNGGNINITAKELSFSGESPASGFPCSLYASVHQDCKGGTGGNINIKTDKLLMYGGALITTSTFGFGDGGNIDIEAREIELNGGANQFGTPTMISSASNTKISDRIGGKGGSLTIKTENLTLSDGGQIATSSIAPEGIKSSDAGYINIKATGTLRIEGVNLRGEEEDGFASGIYAYSRGMKDNAGNGGNVTVDAGKLIIKNGGVIESGTNCNGNAGNINITAGIIEISGSSKGISLIAPGEFQKAFANAFAYDEINSSVSGIYSKSSGGEQTAGAAGQIAINTSRLMLTDEGSISTSSKESGGGMIRIVSNAAQCFNGSISSNVKQGEGNGGDISVCSKLLVMNHAKITANAFSGDGGAVFIEADNFLKSFDSIVSATSERGNQGSVEIKTPRINAANVITEKPSKLIDTSAFTPVRCGDNAKFIIEKKDNAEVWLKSIQ